MSDAPSRSQHVTLQVVLDALRKNHFAVLSTADERGTPHSAGVNYGLATESGSLELYVMTRKHLRKALNIARNPEVSMVVPVPRRLLRFLPPATIQLQGASGDAGLDGRDGNWGVQPVLDRATNPRRISLVAPARRDADLFPQDYARPDP
jgi:Pyridoxamine 5'-phosphate oxidase